MEKKDLLEKMDEAAVHRHSSLQNGRTNETPYIDKDFHILSPFPSFLLYLTLFRGGVWRPLQPFFSVNIFGSRVDLVGGWSAFYLHLAFLPIRKLSFYPKSFG
jgi:hypothetical protein